MLIMSVCCSCSRQNCTSYQQLQEAEIHQQHMGMSKLLHAFSFTYREISMSAKEQNSFSFAQMAKRASRALWTECMECSSPRCDFLSSPRLALISAIPLGISWKWAVCIWTKCHLASKGSKQSFSEKNYTSQPSGKAVWTSGAAEHEAFLLLFFLSFSWNGTWRDIMLFLKNVFSGLKQKL